MKWYEMYGHHMCDTLNVMGTEKSGLPAPLGDISGNKPCITSDKKNRSDNL
jgi:hypothetical protein